MNRHHAPRRRAARRLAVLLLGAVLTAACGGGSDSGPTAAGLGVADIEFQGLSLINESRAAAGLGALDHDPAAAAVARAHSEAMRDQDFLGSTNPVTGRGLRQRLREGGVSFRAAAENVIQVEHRGNAAGVAHAELLASPTHRDNVLGEGFELAGVGVARKGDVYWITQIFVRR